MYTLLVTFVDLLAVCTTTVNCDICDSGNGDCWDCADGYGMQWDDANMVNQCTGKKTGHLLYFQINSVFFSRFCV